MALVERVTRFAASSRAAPLTILALGILIGLTPSWSVSLWTDEAVTISAAQRTPAELLALLAHIDAVHGVYYFLMSGWVQLTGISAVGLRAPSAIALGLIGLGVLYLARRLATPSTALTAAVVALLLPRLTWAGIEARPFVFSALAAVWASWAVVRAAQDPERRRGWALYALLAICGVLFNIYLVFLVAAHAMTLLICRSSRRTLVSYAVAAAGTALVTLPLLLLVRSQQSQLGTGGDRSPLGLLRKILVNQLYLGETPNAAALPPLFGRLWQGSALILAAVGMVMMIGAIVSRARIGDDKRLILALALPWLLLPTVIIALYAVLVAPIYQPRYFTFTAPAAALLIALGARSLNKKIALPLVAVGLVATTVVIASQRTPFSKSGSDWSAAAAVVGSLSHPGEAVYFTPRYDAEPVSLTARRIATAYPGDFQGLVDLTLQETGAESASLDGRSASIDQIRPELDDYRTIWMLYGDRYPAAVVDHSKRVLEDEGFTGVVRWSGSNVTVVEYSRQG